MKDLKRQGFTLIELLIVVAIIAILAAIALPNFLEAQARSKISRAKGELRNLAVAQESYRIDNNHYSDLDAPRHTVIDYNHWPDMNYPNTPNGGTPLIGRLIVLSSPIAYMSSIPKDIFNPGTDNFSLNSKNWNAYTYATCDEDPDPTGLISYAKATGYPGLPKWVLFSYGPQIVQFQHNNSNVGNTPSFDTLYDPTNGTTSKGIIIRLGP